MASAKLSRRVEKVVGYPPVSELGELQRREFQEAPLDADTALRSSSNPAVLVCPALLLVSAHSGSPEDAPARRANDRRRTPEARHRDGLWEQVNYVGRGSPARAGRERAASALVCLRAAYNGETNAGSTEP